MQCIDSLDETELRGKRVLLRTSLNLPVAANGSVGDTFRLHRALPSVRYLAERGARVIVVGYLGRKGDSMRPVAEEFKRIAHDVPVYFFGTSIAEAPQEVAALKDGEVLILESTRREAGEETNDPAFIDLLASLADIFVGDAFAEAHRDYASNVAVAKRLPHYAGLLMRDEINALDAARAPHSPSFAILGGAKFETKAPLISALLASYDKLFLTGALANDVFKAEGLPVGRSLISAELPSADILHNPRFLAPVDVTAESPEKQAKVKKPTEVIDSDKIVDIGPDSVSVIAPRIAEAKFILWNGPTGLYEDGYISYTHAIAEIVAHAVSQGAQAVIGGGDTIAAIEGSGIAMKDLGFLSTGGGAMLEYMLKGHLPGTDALN